MTNAIAQRAEELYRELCLTRTRTIDRMFGVLMILQYVAAIVWSFTEAPLTWNGAKSAVHPHVVITFVLGGLIAVPICLMVLLAPGRTINRYVIAIGQMIFGALLIYHSNGRIETHFHIFGSLAFLALYRDWRILIPATLIVLVDHIGRGIYMPASIYGVSEGAEWRFLEHAAWVVFEDTFLIFSIVHGVKEMRSLAERQANVEVTNANIERLVENRTRELEESLEDVREGEERFRLFCEATSDIIWDADLDTKDVWCSENYHKTFGRQAEGPQHVFGDRQNAIHPEDRERVALTYEATLAGAPTWTVDFRYRNATGDFLHVLERGFVLRNDAGVPVRMVGAMMDVTSQKRAADSLRAKEAAEKSNQAKSQFLSRMSHELRTPLNAILGFAQLLDMDEPSEGQRENISYILSGGKHLLRLINEVLDISRIETGNLAISREPIQLRDALSEALTMVSPLAFRSEIEVTNEAEFGEFVYVNADRQRLLQVFINLLSNAVKYNFPKGEVRVTGEVTLQGTVRVHIADTGLGISSDMADRVFKPFDRLGAESRSEVEGTGLGLALSKNLIEAMGGSISFVSSLGMGTTFSIEIPVAATPCLGDTLDDVVDLILEGNTSMKILYIEDNPSNITLMTRIVAVNPLWNLRTAQTGQAGLNAIDEEKPDVVLLDLDLPDFDGHVVLRKIRAQSMLEGLPVFVISADANPDRIAKLLAAGAQDYITKPFDIKELVNKLVSVGQASAAA